MDNETDRTEGKRGRRKGRIGPAPFSLRLTFEERARLEQLAAGAPLGAYIKERLFADEAPLPPIRRVRTPVKDHAALGEVLAKLGQSRLANNLNQIAKAANIGALDVTPDTEAALHEAKAEVSEIRALLINALGLRESGRASAIIPSPSPRLDP